MHASQLRRPRAGGPSSRTLGAFAVVGVIVAFSLSSTLVKRADTPGVLVAFWRLTIATVIWNSYLRVSGRSIRAADVRHAVVPGVFFGMNLAIFFAGATQNSVANAALIGSLAPLFIVPIGAWLFRERNRARALLFAVVAFGGVVMVLFSAPANGDATVRGNVFGFVAMLLLVGYVVSTRHFRGDMDVAVFMATICPIGALVVFPLALAKGDVLGISGRGWTYTVLLTLLSGVAANGLMVYAQRAIQIGTIAVAQVIQPALAVVWSLLLLGERVRGRQVVGIAIATIGLFAFVVTNQRSDLRARQPAG